MEATASVDYGAGRTSDVAARLAARLVEERVGRRPERAVVLGSGLGTFSARLADAVSVPFADIPHFPAPSVAGHGGRLVVGQLGGSGGEGGVDVAVLEGREMAEVGFPIRVLSRLGVTRPRRRV